MSRSQLPASVSQPHSLPLSETASNLVGHIPRLLRRLHDLEDEEARLNARARQLMELHPAISSSARPCQMPGVATPLSELNIQATESAVKRNTPRTPTRIDPRNFETPVKAFLLMESFALAMSVRSKRMGRIFLGADSTEFGERI